MTTHTSIFLYKILIVCFLGVFLAACDDDKDDNKPATYRVTFDTDGGTPEVASQTVKSGEQAQQPQTNPTKDGFVFTNWINTATGQTHDFSAPVRANLTLKAAYAINTYTVTFDADGGTPDVETQTIASGNQAQEPAVKPTKPDSVVIGWVNTATDQPYDFSVPVTSDLILKASYTIKTYKVRFDTDGGNRIEDVEVSHGETIATPMMPSKIDAFFAGWYADNTFTTPYDFKAPVTAEATLYAKWSGNNIPDDKFRAYLKGQVPNAFDGEQLQADRQEVKALKTMKVSFLGIASLEGIQYFTGLTELKCNNNKLSSLDVSNNTALETLWCNNNQLSSLNISNNTALDTLWCNNNQLSVLDVSNNTTLKRLKCYSNQLRSLDVSGATALKILRCYSNQLSSLDVSGATALTTLNCSSNQLSSLDMKANKNLAILFIYDVDDEQVFPNDQLAEISVHKSKLCDEGVISGGGIKAVFDANKDALEMTITSYDDDGNAVTYDEAAYAAACP